MTFSKYNMPTHHLGSCQSSDSESPRWSLRFRIPDMIPGKANATGPWTTLGVAWLSATDFILTMFGRLLTILSRNMTWSGHNFFGG